jgi:hypothetical protein
MTAGKVSPRNPFSARTSSHYGEICEPSDEEEIRLMMMTR